jgi:hypothetical protein
VQYLADLFWRRWLREYLPSLQQRQKWNELRRNVEVNDIVLVLDEKTPRSSWPLAWSCSRSIHQQEGWFSAIGEDQDIHIGFGSTNKQDDPAGRSS